MLFIWSISVRLYLSLYSIYVQGDFGYAMYNAKIKIACDIRIDILSNEVEQRIEFHLLFH